MGYLDSGYRLLRDGIETLATEFHDDCMVLFGPLVRGEADAESDVDLLIVLTERPSYAMRDRSTSLILDLNLEYGTNLSELIVDRQTWDYGLPSTSPVHKEIEKEGVQL